MAFTLKKQGPCVLDATIFLLVHANFNLIEKLGLPLVLAEGIASFTNHNPRGSNSLHTLCK